MLQPILFCFCISNIGGTKLCEQNTPLFAKLHLFHGVSILLSPVSKHCVELIKDTCCVPERHVCTSSRHTSIASHSIKPYQILTHLPRSPKHCPSPNLPTTSHLPQSSMPPLTSRSQTQTHLFTHQPGCLAAKEVSRRGSSP